MSRLAVTSRLEDLDLRGRVTFIRVDFDVPLTGDRVVQDDRRIRAALPTIEHAVQAGARVVLASGLGTPRGRPTPELSLEPVAARLAVLLRRDVVLADDAAGDGVRKNIKDLREGDVLMLENLDFYAAEARNDEQFVRALADGVDVYVAEAFSRAHEVRASTVGVARSARDRAPGLAFRREVQQLRALLDQPKRPFVAILGGARLTEKAHAFDGLLERASAVLVGGALAYTMLAARGRPVGRSRLEPGALPLAERLLKAAAARKVQLLLPEDHLVAPSFDEAASLEEASELHEGMVGLDIGPKTRERWAKLVEGASTVFWSGPLGVAEWSSAATGTAALARALGASKATTIASGEDTVSALEACGVAHKLTHVSGGGAASLELLANRPMPGVKALDG